MTVIERNHGIDEAIQSAGNQESIPFFAFPWARVVSHLPRPVLKQCVKVTRREVYAGDIQSWMTAEAWKQRRLEVANHPMKNSKPP